MLPDLVTPALLLDRGRMNRNIAAMKARAQRAGVVLRPHAKTAKSVPILEQMIDEERPAATVSTLAEAKALFRAGITDVTYAVGIAPHKLDVVAQLQAAGATVHLLCDDVEIARAVAQRALALGTEFSVFIEVDCGYGRAGVSADSRDLIAIGQALHEQAGTALAGVLTHGGHSYGCRDVSAIAKVAKQEAESVVVARQNLASAALPCPVVSAGSTPTAVHGRGWAGVDELRPGNYVFFDLAQAQIGSCTTDDIAVAVVATVIGHQRQRNGATIDAGSLALSADSSVVDSFGYGLVTDLRRQPIADVIVSKLSQEHGWLATKGRQFPYDLLPIGAQVLVLPSHSCITAAQFDAYHVVENGAIVDRWERIRGW